MYLLTWLYSLDVCSSYDNPCISHRISKGTLLTRLLKRRSVQRSLARRELKWPLIRGYYYSSFEGAL
jgi:hypothetical protein